MSELTPDVVQVLRVADKLKKDLVQIVIDNSADTNPL